MALSAFDSILENKVGFGRYQYMSFIFIGLTQFSDGSEIVALSILLPVLKTEWGISDSQQSMLGSVLFLGILIGSLLGGWVSDKLGRRPALLYGSLIQFVVGVLSTMVTNITLFILVRSIFGICIGFTIPLAPSLASEITPVALRGRAIVAINFFFSLGKFFAVIVAMFCLDSINSGNWKAMLIWCSLPSMAVFFGTLFYLKESPRLLMAVGRIEEGVEVLNCMAAINNPEEKPTISAEEVEELQDWQRNLFAHAEPANIQTLFAPKNKQITTLLWGMWFTLNISFYGMIFILPFILAKLNAATSGTSGLNGMLLTIAGEVPSILVSLYIVEKESFGRKGTIIYANIGACITFFVAFLAPISMLIPLLTLGRFFLKMNFAMIYPLTTELYPTIIRTAGMGFASGVGRLGATIMPYLLMALFHVSTLFPILGFSVLAAIHGCTAYMLPYDTRGKQLDIGNADGEEGSKKLSTALLKLSNSA